jgi:CRP/FNR family cyclic AMP-dependent transcriptional regulator
MLIETSIPVDSQFFARTFGDGCRVLKFKRGDVIFSQGEAADAVYYLQKGKVKSSVVSSTGKEAVVAIINAHDFFGEGCLTGQQIYVATIKTMTEAVSMRIDKSYFVRVMQSDLVFAQVFMGYLLRRGIRVESDLVDQLFNSSEKRLARLLLLLANYGQEGAPEPLIANISQETLAAMIGTTRSRVSFFMNKFRRLGFINYNGRIEVHSSLLNLVLREHPQIDR